MNKLFIAVLAALCFCACSKEVEQPQAPVNKKQAIPSSAFVQYTISKGAQYCDQNSLAPVKLSRLSFKVKFDSSAIYTTAKPANQKDINKLFGFSDNNAMHHEYSARFGWRWSDNALRIFAYNYNSGVRSFKELGTVKIGAENSCSITVSGNKYIFNLNGAETVMPRASTTELAEGYQLYPYFGGDESAPHAISIWIEELP